MQISTQLKIAVAMAVAIALMSTGVVVYAGIAFKEMKQKQDDATGIYRMVMELNTFAREYTRQHEERYVNQFSLVYDQASKLIETAALEMPDRKTDLNDISENLSAMATILSGLVSNYYNRYLSSPDNPLLKEGEQLMLGRLLLRSAEAGTTADQLLALIQQEGWQRQQWTNHLFLGLVLTGIAAMVVMLLSLKRSVITGLKGIGRGADIIRKGDLDHRINWYRNNELGRLAESFNAMTAGLKETTVSRNRLAEEIDERRKVQQALRESQQQLSAILEQLPLGVGVFNPDGQLVVSNPRMKECVPHTIPSKDPERRTRWQAFNPDGSPIPEDRWPGARSLRGENVIPGMEFQYTDESGRKNWKLVSAVPFLKSGNETAGAITVFQDITERKRVEEERETAVEFFRLINRSVSTEELIRAATRFFRDKSGCEAVGIRLQRDHDYPYFQTEGFPQEFVLLENSLCSRDQDGRPVLDSSGNPVLECMCGNVIWGRFDPSKPFFSPRGSFWTNSTTDLLSTTTEADRHAPTRNRCHGQGYESVALIALRCGEDRQGLLQLNDRRVGRFTAEIIAHWERLSDHLCVALAKTMADEKLRQVNETLEQRVAERTRLAEARATQLHALAMELIEAEERERQRVAGLLHEDLQQILAAARIQLMAACPGPQSDPILSRVVELLEESINKSRSLSHELSPAILHHSDLVAALEWLARQMHDQFGLNVQMLSKTVPRIESAPLRAFVFRSVQELLFNVVKHAGVNSASVTLDSNEGQFIVIVNDRGQGFQPEILESNPSTGGFGLLSLRERARYIGGTFEVESTPGMGSRFTLALPIRSGKQDKANSSKSDRQPPCASAEYLIPAGADVITVLIADDHSIMRQGLIRLISGQSNIQVVGEAANGREAVELARQLKPSMIVMDISMPVLDGIEAARLIKGEMPEVKILGLSMHGDEQIAQRMREAGAEGFVSKTSAAVDLVKAITGLFG